VSKKQKRRNNAPICLRNPTPAHRAWLLSSTALLLAGCLAFSPPAWAVDECGGISGGSVTCTPAGNNYTSGITYNPAADLTMIVQDGVTIDSGGNDGIKVDFSTPADLYLTLYDSDPAYDIATTGDGDEGIYIRDADYVKIINQADIYTAGFSGEGIFVRTADTGVNLVNAGKIKTLGSTVSPGDHSMLSRAPG
jgi:hypothetical protein